MSLKVTTSPYIQIRNENFYNEEIDIVYNCIIKDLNLPKNKVYVNCHIIFCENIETGLFINCTFIKCKDITSNKVILNNCLFINTKNINGKTINYNNFSINENVKNKKVFSYNTGDK